MELSTTNILSIVETSKSSRSAFVQRTVQTIKDGNANPLEVWTFLKNWESLIEEMLKHPELKEMALTEGAKYGKKFERFNAKVEITEVGTKYDFSVCNDPLLAEYEHILEAAKDNLTERQKMLKTVPICGMEVRYNDELVTIYPPIKTSTTSLKVTLK